MPATKEVQVAARSRSNGTGSTGPPSRRGQRTEGGGNAVLNEDGPPAGVAAGSSRRPLGLSVVTGAGGGTVVTASTGTDDSANSIWGSNGGCTSHGTTLSNTK